MTSEVAAEASKPADKFHVDSLIPDAWDHVAIKLLDRWAQGLLLENVPIAWTAPAADDPITGLKGTGTPSVVAGSRLILEWAVVASQTCDIAATGPGRVQPFVQVLPLVDYTGMATEKLQAILNYEVTYLAPMKPPGFSGTWAADLRVMLPVSKGLLLERSPRPAFSSEEEALGFSEHLAARLRRPALHEVISEDLVTRLGTGIKGGPRANPEWWQSVEQIRVILTGSRLAPSAIQLLVICQVPLSADERKLWRDMSKSLRALLRPAGISFKPFVFSDMGKLSADLYARSIPLHVGELQRPRVAF